jgi:hypothetical protein
MRDCQFRFVDNAIAVKNNIDVESPGSVRLVSDAFVIAFDRQTDLQQPAWIKVGTASGNGVQKPGLDF